MAIAKVLPRIIVVDFETSAVRKSDTIYFRTINCCNCSDGNVGLEVKGLWIQVTAAWLLELRGAYPICQSDLHRGETKILVIAFEVNGLNCDIRSPLIKHLLTGPLKVNFV